MNVHRKPYFGSVVGFTIWTVFSYVSGLSRHSFELPTAVLIVNLIVFAVAGALYGWLVWLLILRPHLALWTKGAMLFPAIGFCYYVLNHGVADTLEGMAVCCLPMGIVAGVIYDIAVIKNRKAQSDLEMKQYVARNRD